MACTYALMHAVPFKTGLFALKLRFKFTRNLRSVHTGCGAVRLVAVCGKTDAICHNAPHPVRTNLQLSHRERATLSY